MSSVADAAVAVRIVPANRGSWDDLEAVLGGAFCHGGRCYCQRFKLGRNAWPGDDRERAHVLREQTDCEHPRSTATSGLIAYALARAAADFARERGARALEGYPMIPERGKDVPWGELHVGHVSIFTAAGLEEVSRPTLRRAVMRIDF
jgi:hypothetical protein